MSISAFSRFNTPISVGLLPLLLILFLHVPSVAQNETTAEGQTRNVKWTARGDIIFIHYDLAGNTENRYEVIIRMKRESDTSFVIVPRTIEGHVGEGVTAGVDREAQWYYRRDFPLGFSGKDYYFVIEVKKMEEQSNLLYYIVGGTALIGGIIAIIAAKDQPSGPLPPGDLPLPPVRP